MARPTSLYPREMPTTSILSILKPALGPSSSHTFAPFLAARDFADSLQRSRPPRGRVRVVLCGSLAHTGRGHLTDAAVTAGLAGLTLAELRLTPLRSVFANICRAGEICVGRNRFAPLRDIVFDTNSIAPHPNTLRFELLDKNGHAYRSTVYFSIGGGQLVGGSFTGQGESSGEEKPFSMSDVVRICERDGMDLPGFVLKRERESYGNPAPTVVDHIREAWSIMQDSIEAGLGHEGLLPGVLGVERRARSLHRRFMEQAAASDGAFPESTLASIYAIAVAEENADGGFVVTAPTCGSAGVLPACLRILRETRRVADESIHEALLVAGLIGIAASSRASIAGAVVGCQGEIGVASAMAAAAVCYLLGGSVRDQVDRAAETALEHFLGLACDPVGGLVQIPCIERNAAGVVSALNAASLAMLSGGRDRVSLDATLDAMREIGLAMPDRYKETALGGLATVADLDGEGIPDTR